MGGAGRLQRDGFERIIGTMFTAAAGAAVLASALTVCAGVATWALRSGPAFITAVVEGRCVECAPGKD